MNYRRILAVLLTTTHYTGHTDKRSTDGEAQILWGASMSEGRTFTTARYERDVWTWCGEGVDAGRRHVNEGFSPLNQTRRSKAERVPDRGHGSASGSNGVPAPRGASREATGLTLARGVGGGSWQRMREDSRAATCDARRRRPKSMPTHDEPRKRRWQTRRTDSRQLTLVLDARAAACRTAGQGG